MALAADRIGAGNAILGASFLLMVTVVLFYFTSKTLRNLDSALEAKREIEKTSQRIFQLIHNPHTIFLTLQWHVKNPQDRQKSQDCRPDQSDIFHACCTGYCGQQPKRLLLTLLFKLNLLSLLPLSTLFLLTTLLHAILPIIHAILLLTKALSLTLLIRRRLLLLHLHIALILILLVLNMLKPLYSHAFVLLFLRSLRSTVHFLL